MNQPAIVEADLQAYVDDRLPADRRADVEAFLREHPDVSERVRAYVEQKAAIQALHHEKLYYWYYDKFGYALSADIDQARLERLATSACKQLEAS